MPATQAARLSVGRGLGDHVLTSWLPVLQWEQSWSWAWECHQRQLCGKPYALHRAQLISAWLWPAISNEVITCKRGEGELSANLLH